MNTLSRPHPVRRALAGLMAFLIGFGPLTPMALAAETPLADGPISVSIKAKPNIVFTLDDSTSMNLDFLPDYLVVNSLTNAATSYCRSSTGLTGCGNTGSTTMPQYVYAEWGMPTGAGNPWPAGYGGSSYGPPAVMASAFNAMFYNPEITYYAPIKYDGTSYADMNATNTANWTKVPADPFLYPTKYVNLQSKVSVGVWCNTTYAGNFTPPSGVSADRNGLTIGGDHCRINGWPYAAGGNGAPKVNGDYNYPYGRNAAGPANANFFTQTTRTLFCDPAKINKTTSDPSCSACSKVCPVALEDRPIGCDPGCTNPAECTVCTKQCPVATVTPADCGAKTCGTPSLTCGVGQKCNAGGTSNVTACNTVIKANPGVLPATVGKTYEQDANGAGDVCRRNNFTYADGAADGWKYSTSHAVYKVQTGSCGSVSASIYRHYYKSAVQWCDAQLATGGSNDKWRGYGKGTCQAEKTSVYKYPKFVKDGSDLSAAVDNYDYDNAAFELVELNFSGKKVIVRNGTPTDSISHTFEADGETITITRDTSSATPDASELVNYANWFAYYRTRMLAAKTVTSLAFSELTDKFRVGFHTLSNVPASDFLTVADFGGGSGNQRDLWHQKLFGVTVPMGNDTPLLDGVVRVGEWFKSSSGSHPDLSGSTNPINLSCQKNFHMMFTDGYTNQPAKPTVTVANVDGNAIPAKADDTMPVDILELKPGDPWPDRYREGATAVDDSLSDYALHYWLKDLRPPAFDKSVAENNVPATEKDPAKWQHLNFAALSLGTEGVLSSLNVKKTEDEIASGSTKWTTPSPTVYRPGVTGVDDLWHAAVTGRGLFVNARDPAELQSGMVQILKEAGNQQAARAGAAFSSVNFTKDNNYIYRVTIEPGWGGTLTKVLVDPEGGGEIGITTKFHEVLLGQVRTPAIIGDTPWFDDRNVITWSPAAKKAVAFRYESLEAGQLGTLGANEAAQRKVIAYLRGDDTNEGPRLRNFRVRDQVLGDIVSSSPVVVGAPQGQYSDSTDPGYESFKSAQAGRKKMVYVGANDGMLHAFDDATGRELWAYVPSFVYSAEPDKGLLMLTKKEPFFKHQMFVDSTPVAVDVDIGGGTWKTVLIGGMGKGGKGYYAIDVTSPSGIASESDAAGKVMWEFTDAEMGYTYGKPLVAKTYADGWVAIFASGYNATGKAKLYFVSLADGSLLRTLETTADGEAGLAQVSGFVLSYKNQTLEQIYGGDLLGNVWRFDVSSSDPGAWKVEKFADLTSTDGSAQSVTTAPQIEVDFANGVDRYVMIGTGRLLHEDDLATYGEQVQTMYVVRDGTALKMNTSGLPHKPRTDANFWKLTDTTDGFKKLSVKGWYHDLPKGERIIAPIAAELNLLGYAGSLPPENECLPGLAANIYVRDFPFGASKLVDEDGNAISEIVADEGAVGMEFVNIYSDTPNDPTLKLAITLGTDGKTMYIDLAKSLISGDHRMSWRLLGR